MFVKQNVNPKNKKTGDCVIRAIAKAEWKTWIEVFDTLTEIGRKEYCLPNSKSAYQKYLSKYEKINVMHMVDGKKKRYTVNDVCEFGKGTYLVLVAGHLTVVIDGKNYDTWDCGEKSSYIIWKVR